MFQCLIISQDFKRVMSHFKLKSLIFQAFNDNQQFFIINVVIALNQQHILIIKSY